MNFECKICGECGAPPIWRDGKYYCPACGSEIDEKSQNHSPTHQTQTSEKIQNATTKQQMDLEGKGIPITIRCPICRNTNNILINNVCKCSLCGKTFTPDQAYGDNINSTYNPSPVGNMSNTSRRAELEKEKSNRLIWGIVFIFLFWPVAIYHFHKYSVADKELSKLR